ncbi:hypothetical protein DXG01_011215 [Tephrocybe rancida]|nr:hypothetical protein DXG01_011215 [Tephrocybe rancida]
MSFKSAVLALLYVSSVIALPLIRFTMHMEEHSHEQFLTSVRKSLALNNPDGIVDPVFGLLGNAAAAGGAGKIADPTCIQQATADQAFTNAKAAGDVQGQVDALIFRALERNSGKVGLVTAKCTSIAATNPEIAAIQQHQDPASTGAAAVNKAITLELAKQIAKVGGNPQDALKAGTFAPGNLNDATAKGNTCDDANDTVGCIFTQKLIVEDATAAEIDAAVAGTGTGTGTGTDDTNDTNSTDTSCPAPTTVTVTVAPAATATSGGVASVSAPELLLTRCIASAATVTAAPTSGNLQKFTGALGGEAAPAVSVGGRGFVVSGSDDFLNVAAALGRSCDVQHNKCANVANSAAGRSSGLSVGQCDLQNNDCHAAI